MALGDPDAGVSLAEAVILYGGLSKRDQGSHRVTQLKLQWAKNGQPCSSPVTGDEIAGYCERQVAVERRVLDKLRSGELRATGVSRLVGSSISDGSEDIHPDQWRVFVPDFENSSASSPAGALVEGILVFASARMKAAPAAYAYGQKIMRQKAYIAEHKAELKHMGLNEQARRIVAAVGGSDSLAKKAIREEKAQGGQLSRHK
jgi:hypothetical protein